MVTDTEILRLIGLEKEITLAPKKEMYSRQGSKRLEFILQSVDGNENYRAFVRVLEEFEEEFSIGLDYVTREGKSICLLRCNGKHDHRNHRDGERAFYGFHIHAASEEALTHDEEPEHFAELTDSYSTWQDALRYFLKRTNVSNREEHFPWLYAMSLFNQP